MDFLNACFDLFKARVNRIVFLEETSLIWADEAKCDSAIATMRSGDFC